ncbi:MAG TPA: hypothetical protein VFH43_12035 [Candidatus Kapabacteria bacterium]|nr:hypothetical protein [Candidatus Kapabacteria bacterium]
MFTKIKISLLPVAMAILLGLATGLSGCGEMVSAPVEESRSETITPYYFNLDEHHKYTYLVDDKRFAQVPYELSMHMEGRHEDEEFGPGLPIYECDWYSTGTQIPGGYYHGYYAMNDQMAYYMGSNPKPETFVWLDLVAPVERGQRWSFPYGIDSNNTINAEIRKTGLTASIKDSSGEPVLFKDVIEVVYINPAERDTTVKWFGKGSALIAEWKYNSKGEKYHSKQLLKYEYVED